MSRKKEKLIFSPVTREWEFATQEWNPALNQMEWIRRDFSWICTVGKELAIMPIPAKPTV